MIITLTLNPALDISGTVKSLIPNEKSYVEHEIRHPGGNGINAAIVAHRLGAEVVASGFLGGSAGDEIKNLINKEGVPQQFIPIKGKTRSNITVSLEKSHEQTRLSFPGPKISKDEINQLVFYIQHSHPELLIIGGSLPQGISPSFVTKLIKVMEEKNVPVFIDVPGKILSEVYETKPFFIKPNLTEFQEMVGKKVSKISEVVKEARKLSAFIPLICVSSVEGGALLIAANHCWFGKIGKIKIQSTVGAGDSMVGAMAHILTKSKNKLSESVTEKMLHTGLAAAAATLSNRGLNLADKKTTKQLLSCVSLKRID